MWLLNTTTLQLHDFATDIPAYVILSHCWGEGELSFQDMSSPPEDIEQRPGYIKMVRCCEIARSMFYDYVWIDTVCIDKRSSAELSEAINSMYRWYANANWCLIYFSDVPKPSTIDITKELFLGLNRSRWFTRSWTLQELIANPDRRFYLSDWTELTREMLGQSPETVCSYRTKIPRRVLKRGGATSSRFSVAERMSWASKRRATRPEDRAYSLMGIFNVNMPVLYGEGSEHAFRRLQLEIIKTSFDHSVFAWRGRYSESGLLARDPDDFEGTPPIKVRSDLMPFTMTNVGLSLSAATFLVAKDPSGPEEPYQDDRLMALNCHMEQDGGWPCIGIRLRRVSTQNTNVYDSERLLGAYRRVACRDWVSLPIRKTLDKLVVLEDEQIELVKLAREYNDRKVGATFYDETGDNVEPEEARCVPRLLY